MLNLDKLFADEEVLKPQSVTVRASKKSGSGDTGHDDAYQDDLGGTQTVVVP